MQDPPLPCCLWVWVGALWASPACCLPPTSRRGESPGGNDGEIEAIPPPSFSLSHHFLLRLTFLLAPKKSRAEGE